MNGLAFEMTGVGKTYPHFRLEGVDLRLEQGQIMGLIGPNGAGKSTTIRILMGLLRQDRGEVRVLGHDMPRDEVAAKYGIGFVSEDMHLYKQATLEWHMRFIASIYPDWDPVYAQQLLERFCLRPLQTLRRFSHGERVKAALLLALARRPRLLVLDEPTTGLDPIARHELLRELGEVMLDDERSVLFSSHNTRDVEQIADQIAFIDRGRVVDALDKEQYLERWRRLRVSVPAGQALPSLPEILAWKGTGPSAAALTRSFHPALPAQLELAGLRVERVETLTLEEIFITTVEHNRERKA